MKRDADDATAVSKTKRKKGVAASAGDTLRKDQRQAQHAAAAAFDTAAWAGQTMASDLADTLTKLYHQAMQPSEDGCWQYIGLPLPKVCCPCFGCDQAEIHAQKLSSQQAAFPTQLASELDSININITSFNAWAKRHCDPCSLVCAWAGYNMQLCHDAVAGRCSCPL